MVSRFLQLLFIQFVFQQIKFLQNAHI
jgi:hypothetical protein